jgi:hypothetical protein
MTQAVKNPLRDSYLSFDDVLVIVQLADMATAALERKDAAQVDAALRKIISLRAKYANVRQFVDTITKRRSLGPDVHLP